MHKTRINQSIDHAQTNCETGSTVSGYGAFYVSPIVHYLVALDVRLRTVDHAEYAELDGDDSAAQHVHRVCAGIHQIKFSDDCQCPPSYKFTAHSFKVVPRMEKKSIVQPLPSGSTALASFNASDVAMSVLAGVTARMMELGFVMYFKIISRI